MYKRFCALFMIAFLIMAIFGCIPEPFEELVCTRVIDGDTIEITGGVRVRYIGVNAPETDEPGGKEATEANKVLVEGKMVRLEDDVQKLDKYGRSLAYVYLEDGTFVNAELVRIGYAQVSTYPPNVKYVDTFIEYQREALTEKRGMWAGVSQDDIVYITPTGKKYHKLGCRYLNENPIPISRQEAIVQGYTPCSVCKP